MASAPDCSAGLLGRALRIVPGYVGGPLVGAPGDIGELGDIAVLLLVALRLGQGHPVARALDRLDQLVELDVHRL